MLTSPSGALAGAAASAVALAGVVSDLAAALPLNTETARTVQATCLRLQRVSAPRSFTPAAIGAIGADRVGAVQAVARGSEAGDASAALYAAAGRARCAVPTSASPVLTRAYRFAAALAASVEVACLGEAFLAEARTGFADRRAAVEARARISLACEESADRIAPLLGQEVAGVLATVARETTAYLAQNGASLRPIVQVDAGRSFPSTALAWSLYGDPARAVELVARNRVGAPLFMPASLEALAPDPS